MHPHHLLRLAAETRQRPAKAIIDHDGKITYIVGQIAHIVSDARRLWDVPAVGNWAGDLLANGQPYGVTPAARAALTDPRLDAASRASADVVLAYASPE